MEALDDEDIEDEILESIDAFKDYLGIQCMNSLSVYMVSVNDCSSILPTSIRNDWSQNTPDTRGSNPRPVHCELECRR